MRARGQEDAKGQPGAHDIWLDSYVIPDVARDRICLHITVEAAAFIDLRYVELHRSLVLGLDQTISPRTM